MTKERRIFQFQDAEIMEANVEEALFFGQKEKKDGLLVGLLSLHFTT